MRAAEAPSLKEFEWKAVVDPDTAEGPRRQRGKRDGVTSFRAIVASSAFLVLFATTMLVGGRAAIDPLLRSATSARDKAAVGDIVYTMPDGRFCRHMSFDNATAEMVEGTIMPCPESIVRDHGRNSRGFAWGAAN